jgi:hypothetical protein
MKTLMFGCAAAAILCLAVPSLGAAEPAGAPAGLVGSYVLDEGAMRAAAEKAPQGEEREKAERRLAFVIEMNPRITLEPGGKGQGSFLVPVGDQKGQEQTFAISWEWKGGKIVLSQPENKESKPTTCVPKGKVLRCNEGGAAMIYVKS